MLLAIIGAGASYDCHEDISPILRKKKIGSEYVNVELPTSRPPLTQNLFGQLPLYQQIMAEYPAVGPLAKHLRSSENSDTLEERLAEYSAGTGKHENRSRHLMALRFYLRDLLHACSEEMLSADADASMTNYTSLVHSLDEWSDDHDTPVCYVNFNYDYLLEHAAYSVSGFDYNGLDAYIGERLSILKPHGLVLWERGTDLARPQADDGQQYHRVAAERVIESAKALLHDELGTLRTWKPGNVSTSPGIPALALPLRDKTNFVWPKEQECHFKSTRKDISALLTVGWRAADHHFLDLLANMLNPKLPVLVVTGGQRGHREADDVVQKLGLSHPHEYAHVRKECNGFSALLRDGTLKQWLDSLS